MPTSPVPGGPCTVSAGEGTERRRYRAEGGGVLTDAHARLALFQLADSAFPAGLFAFSHGLETAVQDGSVADATSLESFVGDWLAWTVGPGDATFVASAHRAATEGDVATLADLAAWAHASRLPREGRAAAARPGARMAALAVKLMGETTGAVALRALVARREPLPYSVAFGAAAAAFGCDAPSAVLASLHGAASGLLGAALRLMKVDHEQTQSILRHLAPVMTAIASDSLAADWRESRPGHVRFDACQMRHETAHVRLFMS